MVGEGETRFVCFSTIAHKIGGRTLESDVEKKDLSTDSALVIRRPGRWWVTTLVLVTKYGGLNLLYEATKDGMGSR